MPWTSLLFLDGLASSSSFALHYAQPGGRELLRTLQTVDYSISPIMRVCYVLLLATATLLASATAVSESKLSTSVDVQVHSTRFLRVDNAADTNDEERAVPVLGKITSYLNQKTLDFWLHQGKKPKQVFKLLRLDGLNGRAVTKRNHKYNVRYLAMWKNKNAGTRTTVSIAN
ncbi:hypothetical protein PR002_g21202 [Phytophthora rubi]|uniref:RxLR effector protein n=2 Tax=Phytophthora rubi TaxID=129364 RepID=A0A6A3J6B8_9STRA|nr:hypothetical protein PR002_g21202 [Phytophthora rubi]